MTPPTRSPDSAAATELADFRVRRLGRAEIPSPLALSNVQGDLVPDYVLDDTRVLHEIELKAGAAPSLARSFEKAGPRERLFFDPRKVTAAIVTAGGSCPGINNVIRSLVLHLHYKYQVPRVLGFRYGFAGLDPAASRAMGAGAGGERALRTRPIELGPDEVRDIHSRGGTILGTSRGEHDVGRMVDTLVAHRVDVLFAIGGDGTMRGTHAIAEEAHRRGLALSVVGVPKTIDNDIPFVDKTFGFETAIAMARVAIDAAHTEAASAENGVGLVKLMGREAGFIAAQATLASHEVNLCLVPEVDFSLDGPGGLLVWLERRLAARGHAVIVVAEGCGKQLVEASRAPLDASGNLRFAAPELDIGRHLKAAIERHFAARGEPVTLKYIDPSYLLRGVPANAVDSVFCDDLARHAVHAAMAGKTDLLVGRCHRVFTHVPLPLALSACKRIDPDQALWLAVTESTGQPLLI